MSNRILRTYWGFDGCSSNFSSISNYLRTFRERFYRSYEQTLVEKWSLLSRMVSAFTVPTGYLGKRSGCEANARVTRGVTRALLLPAGTSTMARRDACVLDREDLA